MLSRVAERLYWLARYLERAENTARLVRVYSALLLDLPDSAGLGWDLVLDINGCRPGYAAAGGSDEARAMLAYLLYEDVNPASLLNVLNQARENARTTRDVVPTEGWRTINELCLYARAELPKSARLRQRTVVMDHIIESVHGVTGLLAGTMSQGQPYEFVRLGRNLERADMTTRIIDVAAALLMTGRPELKRYDNTLWMAVLRCLSGYQMYRQYVRRRVHGPDVIHFLLQDRKFPRAVAHCIGEVHGALGRLPRGEQPAALAQALVARLGSLDTDALDSVALHRLIDDLQVEVARIDAAMAATWFYPADAA